MKKAPTERTPSRGKSVVVIGGGVAGIAASIALADQGFRVRLIEKRPLLGGRASSWIEHNTGERLDACQHGTMRCCTNLGRLFDLLGVHDQIRYHDTLHFLDSAGVRSVISGGPLPAPLHTSLSFLRFKSLGLADKMGIARAMLAMLRANPGPVWDTISIAEWFAGKRQTQRALDRFWTPILVSACNESLDRISATHAFKVFRDGFLASSHAFHFGVPTVPLGSLYTEPAIAYLKKRGGCVETRTIVDRLEFDADGRKIARIVLNDGETVEADYYVSALQFDLLLKLLPGSLVAGEPYFSNLNQMELSPIIGVHFWFDQYIDCPEALALLDRRSDWIFHKNLNFESASESSALQGGSYLSVVISADPDLTSMSKEQIERIVLDEVHQVLPETRSATVVKSYLVKERKATFSPKPGFEALRPDQRSPIGNLLIAGEWTRTGWPSTMESAAKSGFLAAERILEAEGRSTNIAQPDHEPSGLCRWLMRR